MKKPLFTGACTALITPFSNGKVNLSMLKKLLQRQMDAGIGTVVLCGTTGESPTLSLDEKLSIFRCAKDYCGSGCTIIAGTGSNSTCHAVELSRAAEACGVDGLLVVSPYYNKATPEGLFAHYSAIAGAVQIPVILYNVPSRTGMSVSAETYARLAKHPNIFGTKEASGDFGLMLKIKALCPPDFALYSGNDDHIVPVLSLGGVGVISTMANVIPAETQQICDLWEQNDREGAAKLQIRCQPLIQALFREVNPIPVKAAMAMLGLDSGYVRQPLTEIGSAAREELRQAMGSLGLL